MEHQTMRVAGDLRDERFKEAATAQVPSPNLGRVYADLEPTGKVGKLMPLARKIENGDATGDEDEAMEVYDAFTMLLDMVQDLAGMCQRREAALAECGVQVGG